jgi:hypothetical protein
MINVNRELCVSTNAAVESDVVSLKELADNTISNYNTIIFTIKTKKELI